MSSDMRIARHDLVPVARDLRGLPAAAAVLSPDGRYRYSLTRRWAAGPVVRWIMLNPSTADAQVADPTIRRCMGFARAWGYGGIVVHNLYALRATDPGCLARHLDPVGPDNDRHLLAYEAAAHGDLTICAWGAHPMATARANEVLATLHSSGERPHHLGRTRSGAPRHPLRLARTTEPTELDPLEGPAADPHGRGRARAEGSQTARRPATPVQLRLGDGTGQSR